MMKNSIRPIFFGAAGMALLLAFLLPAYFARAEGLSAPDPIWCPVGVNPISGVGGCSPSYRTFTELVAWLHANDPSQPGVIWLERTYNSAFETAEGFTLNGRDFANFDNQPLTIQGGWNGTGLTTINHTDPSVFSGDSLYFYYWNGALTVNDIDFDHTTASGLSIYTTGDIHLSNVHAQYSVGPVGNGFGAALSNHEGTGDILIVNSSFNYNHDLGLHVGSSGAVTLRNITANGNNILEINGGGGVSIHANTTDGIPQPVTISGTNTFNDNYLWGLSATTDGPIELQDVTANGNHYPDVDGFGFGVILNNSDAATPQPIRVIGRTHIFNDNTLIGLMVHSNGSVYAENITANGNGYSGAQLRTWGADLTLDGLNIFMNNGKGLYAGSAGTTSLHQMTVEGNLQDGIRLLGTGTVVVTCSSISSNGNYGIDGTYFSGPLLVLNEVVFDGHNLAGDYLYAGTVDVRTGGCSTEPVPPVDGHPLRIIESTHTFLACGIYSGTALVLPGGVSIVFRCPTLGDLIAIPLLTDSIPAPAPEGSKLMSALDVSLTHNGVLQKITPGSVTVSFPISKEMKDPKLAILFWDGKTWVDLNDAQFEDGRKVFEGGHMTAEGVFEAQFNFTGIFMLVSR